MGKVIEISPELEKDILLYCEDELYYHIFESGCADEYETEIKAQCILLELLGYKQTADKWREMYREWCEEHDVDI